MSSCYDLMYLAHKFYTVSFCTQLFSKGKKKNPSAKTGETNCKACLVLARMVEENTIKAIFLLLVGGIQINKKLDGIRVVMQVINIFKALGSLWLKLSAKGYSININHKQGPSVSRTVSLAPLLTAFKKEGIKKKLPGDIVEGNKLWGKGKHDLIQVQGL